MGERIIGIMGAMPEEIEGILKLLTNRQEVSYGRRTYYTGLLNEIKVVVVFSRWGKVAAAATATNLVLTFKITDLIFIGVAGAIHDNLRIGDFVVAKRLLQHDMDARPLMSRYEIPLLGVTYFESDSSLFEIARRAVSTISSSSAFNNFIDASDAAEFSITSPKILAGDIASGDQFFSSQTAKDTMKRELPEVLCVEMEGAAVAQVSYEYEIPFVVIRTISDASNDSSHLDFPAFISKIASKYSVAIIREIFKHLQEIIEP